VGIGGLNCCLDADLGVTLCGAAHHAEHCWIS
jgi:hypothetical protein